MEFRITAENPFENFLPSPGRIHFLRPAGGPGVRDASGVFSGWEVTPHYDPLIAKLIVWGEDRGHCLARAASAVGEYRVDGIATTLPFFDRVLRDPRFVRGDIDVGYVGQYWDGGVPPSSGVSLERESGQAALVAAAVAAYRRKPPPRARDQRPEGSAWKQAGIREQSWSRL